MYLFGSDLNVYIIEKRAIYQPDYSHWRYERIPFSSFFGCSFPTHHIYYLLTAVIILFILVLFCPILLCVYLMFYMSPKRYEKRVLKVQVGREQRTIDTEKGDDTNALSSSNNKVENKSSKRTSNNDPMMMPSTSKGIKATSSSS